MSDVRKQAFEEGDRILVGGEEGVYSGETWLGLTAPEGKVYVELGGDVVLVQPDEIQAFGSSMRARKGMRTEADIIRDLETSQTLGEQRILVAELERFRQARTAAVQADRDIDLSSSFIRDTLTPVVAYQQHTAATDWLGEAAGSPGPYDHQMRVEASMWFNKVSPEVRADREEFAEQAQGMARRLSGQYGLQAEAAFHAFLAQVGRLWKQSDDKPGKVDEDQSGNAESAITDYDTEDDQEPFLAEDWPEDDHTGVHPEMPGAGEGPRENEPRPEKTSRRRGSFRKRADTCSTCGDAIERDPEGEDPRTWHHTEGGSHDHEAKPSEGNGNGDSKESRRKARIAKLSVDDVERAVSDDRHQGYGYAGMSSASPRLHVRVDEAVARVANELGLSYDELFHWTNSKAGRWTADYMVGGWLPDNPTDADIEKGVRENLNRATMDDLLASLASEENPGTYLSRRRSGGSGKGGRARTAAGAWVVLDPTRGIVVPSETYTFSTEAEADAWISELVPEPVERWQSGGEGRHQEPGQPSGWVVLDPIRGDSIRSGNGSDYVLPSEQAALAWINELVPSSADEWFNPSEASRKTAEADWEVDDEEGSPIYTAGFGPQGDDAIVTVYEMQDGTWEWQEDINDGKATGFKSAEEAKADAEKKFGTGGPVAGGGWDTNAARRLGIEDVPARNQGLEVVRQALDRLQSGAHPDYYNRLFDQSRFLFEVWSSGVGAYIISGRDTLSEANANVLAMFINENYGEQVKATAKWDPQHNGWVTKVIPWAGVEY